MGVGEASWPWRWLARHAAARGELVMALAISAIALASRHLTDPDWRGRARKECRGGILRGMKEGVQERSIHKNRINVSGEDWMACLAREWEWHVGHEWADGLSGTSG